MNQIVILGKGLFKDILKYDFVPLSISKEQKKIFEEAGLRGEFWKTND